MMRRICSVTFMLLLGYAPATPAETNAVVFAWQAGAIAGAAEACGQDISGLLSRINEATDILAVNNADKLNATTVFQNKTAAAYEDQSHILRRIPCSIVLQDYYSMPILRDDYRTTVLPKLSPSGNPQPQ